MRDRRVTATQSAILTLCLAVAACTSTPRRPPNILLITLDTTRADHIGAYGSASARTPNLDRLAANGVLFERTIAAAPITLPAHASMLTGRYPFSHGVRNNGNFTLADNIPTLATVLHENGYRTAAFVSAFVLDRRFGLARGFDRYDDRLEPGSSRGGEVERRGDHTVASAMDWIAAQAGNPFFAWVHLYDPHDPYDPPPPFRSSFADRPYDGEIAFDDDAVGTLLQCLDATGARDSTIVAIVGDHGESLGEHQEETHSVFVYEATLRVPFILSWPQRLPIGRRISALVRGIDVAPTLLDLAGRSGLAGAQGTSLLPVVEARASEALSAYAESYFPLFYMNWAPLRSLQDGRWKYVDAPEPELYDLSTDAQERTNVAPREPARTAALRRALDTLTGGGAGALNQRTIDAETAQKLAALGYVGTAAGGMPDPSDNRPDPKRMISVFNDLRRANALATAGRPVEAEAVARAALRREPRNAFAAIMVANAEMDQGRFRDAIDAYKTYLALVPTSAEAHHRMAICYARLGETDRALAEEEATLAIDPRDAAARQLRGGLLAAKGRIDEALQDLRTAVDIAPSNATLRIGLARVLITASQLDEAGVEIRRALEVAPRHPAGHAAAAALLVARGRLDDAISEFTTSLDLDATQDDVRLDLAQTLERSGRRAQARSEYERLAAGRDTPPEIRRAARARLR